MNKAIIIGRLTKDVESRATQDGGAVANFTVAVDRRAGANGMKEADFLPVVAFGKTAENCAKYLVKGALVGVSGRMQTRNYVAQDGGKRYVTEIVADDVQFLDKRQNDG